MKRSIGLITIFILSVLFAAFNVPARIMALFENTNDYSEENYDKTYSGMLPEGKIEIELDSFDNKPIVVYQYEDTCLELKSVRVDETGYFLELFSYGDYTCDYGVLLVPGVPIEKQTLETEKGPVLYALRGEGPGNKKGMNFTLGIAPAEGSDIGLEEIGEMKLELPIYTWLKIMVRK